MAIRGVPLAISNGHNIGLGNFCTYCGEHTFDIEDIPCPGPDHYTPSDF